MPVLDCFKTFSKSKLNFVIDALLFLCIAAIGGLGFLMKWTLPPGREVAKIYGRGGGYLTFFDMGRHEWGSIHLVLGITFLSLLALHIMLHWATVVCLYRQLITNRVARIIIAPIFFAVAVVLLGFSFVVSPDDVEHGHGGGGWRGSGEQQGSHECGGCPSIEAEQPKVERGAAVDGRAPGKCPYSKEAREAVGPIIVRGYDILGDVAKKYDIPLDYLKNRLGLSETISGQEKMAWLRRRHGFQMADVERIIEDYRKKR